MVLHSNIRWRGLLSSFFFQWRRSGLGSKGTQNPPTSISIGWPYSSKTGWSVAADASEYAIIQSRWKCSVWMIFFLECTSSTAKVRYMKWTDPSPKRCDSLIVFVLTVVTCGFIANQFKHCDHWQKEVSSEYIGCNRNSMLSDLKSGWKNRNLMKYFDNQLWWIINVRRNYKSLWPRTVMWLTYFITIGYCLRWNEHGVSTFQKLRSNFLCEENICHKRSTHSGRRIFRHNWCSICDKIWSSSQKIWFFESDHRFVAKDGVNCDQHMICHKWWGYCDKYVPRRKVAVAIGDCFCSDVLVHKVCFSKCREEVIFYLYYNDRRGVYFYLHPLLWLMFLSCLKPWPVLMHLVGVISILPRIWIMPYAIASTLNNFKHVMLPAKGAIFYVAMVRIVLYFNFFQSYMSM